jgi:hypothetical protein
MPSISFQQGVALAFGAYIDPVDSINNARFDLTCEGASASLNVNGIFGRNTRTGLVDNRLSALFHGRRTDFGDVASIDFTLFPVLGNLGSQAYTLVTTSTAVADSSGLDGYDLVFTGYNATEKQLDYRAGGDISNNSIVAKAERNYHRTGLAIWNKLKK